MVLFGGLDWLYSGVYVLNDLIFYIKFVKCDFFRKFFMNRLYYERGLYYRMFCKFDIF